MPFEMTENLIIKGRKGDTASFTFEFEEDISHYCLVFQVKKNENDPDEKAIIRKEILNPVNNSVTFELTSEDTNLLTSSNQGYTTYKWGLKINNGINFAQTLIPIENTSAPSMCIYPAIIERF